MTTQPDQYILIHIHTCNGLFIEDSQEYRLPVGDSAEGLELYLKILVRSPDSLIPKESIGEKERGK